MDEESEVNLPQVFEAEPPPAPPPRWLALLQLLRAPNVFTAIADVAMGYLVTTGRIQNWSELILLASASSALYTAGMVLNDVFDFAVDQQERPRRPLPSGQIPRGGAAALGWILLGLGAMLGWLAGWMAATTSGPWWRPGVVALLLAACIVLYDCLAKKTWVGPIVMGSCRFLNVLLGMSLYGVAFDGAPSLLGWDTSHFMIAGGIGIYIVGVTLFARSEATTSPRNLLALGVGVMAVGLLMLAVFPALHRHAFAYRVDPGFTWPLAILVMSIWILRRCVLAIGRPEPMFVQSAVKTCILSLIILDATICLDLCSNHEALLVLSLLLPTMMLGRWVYST